MKFTADYTREDLSCAGVILACKGRTDRFGNALYSEEFIQWAKDVMSYFGKKAWAAFSTSSLSLKEAWAFVLSIASNYDGIITAIEVAVTGERVSYGKGITFVASEGVTGKSLKRRAKDAIRRGLFLIV